jgi:(p)ppGpp synthase/HD superfamily hydrolase
MFDDNQRLVAAIDLALRAHGTQVDKAGMPYILHPLHVMGLVHGIDAKIVAVLHDVVEDTDATLLDIANHQVEFSHEIVQAVDAITKRDGETNREYWTRVRANPLALRVKLADIAHNSSEERLSALSLEEAGYLRQKYRNAFAFLTEAD